MLANVTKGAGMRSGPSNLCSHPLEFEDQCVGVKGPDRCRSPWRGGFVVAVPVPPAAGDNIARRFFRVRPRPEDTELSSDERSASHVHACSS